ncbi:MAG: sugar phosphate isomerase/epimerase [Ferruginibacter sp.]|nr:sugar phosphate isomerase/epimerase [Ferruginibacter sp.]
MQLKVLCPQWGHEYLPVEDFFIKVKSAGYDGVDTWLPENVEERKKFIRLLDEYGHSIVSHQHQAKGNNFNEFCSSFEYYLNLSMECGPMLINSHTGRDYFNLDDQLRLIDIADNFSVKNNIRIAHETHRGRIGYSPQNAGEVFTLRPAIKITADLSHWVCVTESYLENFKEILSEAILRTEHIHARVGFIEGPQIPDPRSPFWQEPVQFFLKIWGEILAHQKSIGTPVFTITPEFGPPPYMWVNPIDNTPIASQWDINVFMKDLLIKNFG